MKFDSKTAIDVAKKNWVSILFGVIMLIAIVAVYTVVASQQTDLQTALNKRQSVYTDLTRLMNKVRHQPVVSIDPDAVPPDLKQYPNNPIITSGEQAIGRVQEQSLALKDQATRMNVHEQLVAGALPNPRDAFQFQQVYLQQFQTVLPGKLKSVTPPTNEEINIRGDAEEKRLTEAQPHTPSGEIYNKEALQQNVAQMRSRLPEQMRREAATQHKMYMAPTALSIHPALAGGTGVQIQADAEQIWFAQVGLWAQQDVVDAIVELNKSSNQVGQSPVKQLVQIAVSPTASLYAMPNRPATGGPAPAAPAPTAAASDTEALPKDYSVSPTGRICNGVFDVVHFTVVLNVQAVDVERVIQELERNRLLTVYQVDILSVNSAAMQQQGYFYGRNPVVTLTMNCEEILMRDWTTKLMPKAIRDLLGVPEAQPAQPQASAY